MRLCGCSNENSGLQYGEIISIAYRELFRGDMTLMIILACGSRDDSAHDDDGWLNWRRIRNGRELLHFGVTLDYFGTFLFRNRFIPDTIPKTERSIFPSTVVSR